MCALALRCFVSALLKRALALSCFVACLAKRLFYMDICGSDELVNYECWFALRTCKRGFKSMRSKSLRTVVHIIM